MYPSIHDQHMHGGGGGGGGYQVEGHPGFINPGQGQHELSPKHPPSPPPPFSTTLQAHRVPGQWSTGLCHCCDDPDNCMITFFCPCITFGQIAEIVNRGSPSCAQSGALYGVLLMTGFACLYSCFYRSKLRGQYDLSESPCVDCLVHFCCETCALCQEYRELNHRGFDMGIGWEANVERQRRGVTAAPMVAQGMTRY